VKHEHKVAIKNHFVGHTIEYIIILTLVLSSIFAYLTSRFIPKTIAGSGITLDAVSAPSAPALYYNPLSWQHTVGTQSNMILIIGVNTDSPSNPPLNVKVNGSALGIQFLTSQTCQSSTCYAALYYLKNPPSGNITITVNPTTGNGYLTAGAASFYNVNLTSPFDTPNASTGLGFGSYPSITHNNTDQSQLILDTVGHKGVPPGMVCPNSGQTGIWAMGNPSNANYLSLGSVMPGSLGQTSMGWNLLASGYWAEIAVALKSISASPPTLWTPAISMFSGCVPTSTPAPTQTPTPVPGGVNITNLNIGITNSIPWIQTYGLDLRVDSGYTNPVPSGTACGSGPYASGTTVSLTSPGIIFSGDTNADFGLGQASKNPYNWVVGGSSYPEVYGPSTSSLKTSASKLLTAAQKTGIQPVDLTTICNPNDCVFSTPPPKGIYTYDGGEIHFKSPLNTTFTAGNTYIFVTTNPLGDIYFEGTASVVVPKGAVVIFSAKRDIIIAPSVNPGSNSCPAGVPPTGQLQGIFSADRNITIQGANDCANIIKDNMLNVDGVLIAINGSLQNQRDLCNDNTSFPSLTVKARPDFILNMPGFLTEQQTISHEEAP
jgi:hypothetical protein